MVSLQNPHVLRHVVNHPFLQVELRSRERWRELGEHRRDDQKRERWNGTQCMELVAYQVLKRSVPNFGCSGEGEGEVFADLRFLNIWQDC